MNILVISHFGNYNDVSSSFVHKQAVAYAKLGHNVRVLVPVPFGKAKNGKRTDWYEFTSIDGVEIIYLRFPSFSGFGRRTGLNNFSLKLLFSKYKNKILNDFQPDIIHAHTIGLDSSFGAYLKRDIKCSLVVTTHGSDTMVPYNNGKISFIKRSTKYVDAIVTVSTKLKNILEKAIDNCELHTVLNGIDFLGTEEDIFNRLLKNKVYEPTDLVINQTSSLIKSKNVDITIRAFEQLLKKYKNMSLTIIGSGEESLLLNNLCKELNLGTKVCFTGQLEHNDVLEEMSKAQFFIMPSVNEGFGIVYAEAMAAGCITIGTMGEGIEDLIENSVNGFLVPPNDVDSIVRAVEYCLNNREEMYRIAKNGMQIVSKLTWENNAKQYIKIFEELIVNE